MTAKCLMCKRGSHRACTGCECTHASVKEVEEQPARTTRAFKPDHALKDQQSTGRKRAARAYPIICTVCDTPINLRNKKCLCEEGPSYPPCDWRGKANCGGGEFPMLGCVEGLATDRHHGPDKRVTNNEAGNVHLICVWCHHGWHGKNDPGYDWNKTSHGKHEPRPMTEEERVYATMRDHQRRNKKVKRVRD